ncbi:hypothetical protein [Parahaliea mediterranea]|uniref:hypothetical protein n=1 Tax=Parahaliea mediterranea TaxID=651086 RepID=UPI001F4EBD26|nr:hypothetical protein [Parahaliea mediterranea]
MPQLISRTLPIVLLSAGLAACAPVPEQPVSAAAPTDAQTVPELTLNLPQQAAPAPCDCGGSEAQAATRDQTFLERGYDALSRGDHIEAVKYFQRYQRLESSPEAEWEAGIGIAFVSMVSSSPFLDPEASRKSWRRLNKELTPDMKVHPTSLIMRDALESFAMMDRHISELESNNSMLQEDLQKREEALKRLRELTLGQRGARQ